jgi:ketosteroid isomerase-like protein
MSRPGFRQAVWIGGVVGVAAACASVRSPAVDERARVEAATQRYAALIRGAPVDSVLTAYTENGELEIPGVGALKGRKAIRDFLAPLAAAVSVSATEMQSDSLAVSGNVAQSSGRYRQVAGPKGGPAAEYRGAFHATWAREADGQWRISRLVMQPMKSP